MRFCLGGTFGIVDRLYKRLRDAERSVCPKDHLENSKKVLNIPKKILENSKKCLEHFKKFLEFGQKFFD